MAIQYAIDNKRKTVTLVHKGNIMKFTEGAFRDWGYEVGQGGVPRSDRHRGRGDGRRHPATGKVLINDRDRRQRVPADPDPARPSTTCSRRRT